MPRPHDRTTALAHLQSYLHTNRPIIGSGAGCGLTASALDSLTTPSTPSPISLVILYNSGFYRMHALSSLAGLMPYSNANTTLLELTPLILPQLRHTPAIAGICATDPTRSIAGFLREVKGLGFAGVQNFPTVGLIDGTFRVGLEETGLGYEREVEMVREAVELGLLATPYVFEEGQAGEMAKAGADVLVAHMGLTVAPKKGKGEGTVGGKTGKTLGECVELIKGIAKASREVNPDVIVLCHGGPITTPEDAEYVMKRCEGLCQGFYGASSMERWPVEEAVRGIAKRFGEVSIR